VEAFAGFAGTAVVTIAGILVVSDGLVRTGAVQFAGERIIHGSGGDERRLLLLVMLTMLVASAFINNTAIVAMFLPVLLSVAHEFEIAPSKVLIPLSTDHASTDASAAFRDGSFPPWTARGTIRASRIHARGTPPMSPSRRVLLHLDDGRRVPVEPEEVFFLEAAGDETEVRTRDRQQPGLRPGSPGRRPGR